MVCVNYTNREVVKRLKQYDMFLSSLNLTTDSLQKERICDQLDKIEKQILLDTNTEYEEEYIALSSKESKLLDEEKDRLRDLISLIEGRREYLNQRKERHRDITGSLVELTTFLGEDKLTFYKRKLKIIEKYEDNKALKESLISDMKSLDIKISEASRNVKANMRLNDMLESKMIALVSKSLDKLNLYNLMDNKEEIFNKYSSFSYAKDMAKDNLDSSIELKDDDMKLECEKMLSDITKEYDVYDKEVNIIKLIEIYDKPTSGYEELLKKREEINDILRNISGTELYNLINDELSKGYNTIKLEKQDIKNYDDLRSEREKKNKRLYEIDEENNSKEFKELLEDLIKSENKFREERIRLARNQESKEREKKLQEEQKIEASRVRRQKLIEEARLKEQLERTEKLKELQKKTVINPKKEELFEKVQEELEEKVKKEQANFIKDEKIKNPLENKSLDDMLKYEDTFDTNELFENTKIVPNKVNNDMESSLFKVASEAPMNEKEDKKEDTPIWKPIDIPTDNSKADDLFKDVNENVSLEVPAEKEEVKKEIPKEKIEKKDNSTSIFPESPMKDKTKDNSIYDILENNQNIIWKTTESKKSFNEIPVIENKNKNSSGFPELGSKEGEVLWKETL